MQHLLEKEIYTLVLEYEIILPYWDIYHIMTFCTIVPYYKTVLSKYQN